MTPFAKQFHKRTWKQYASKFCSKFFLALLLISGCATAPRVPGVTLYEAEYGYRHWPLASFPLEVRVDSSMDPRYIQGTQAAVDHWNSLVGRRFLYVTLHEGDVWERANSIDVRERNLGRSTRDRRVWGLNSPTVGGDGRIIRSLVEFDEGLPDDAIFEIALHEFGHALGLQHDEEDRDSIMFPYVSRAGNQSVRPEDIEAIQQMLPGHIPIALLDSPGDPWPLAEAPVLHFPPPCPGVHLSIWLDVVIEDDGPWGPCVGPSPRTALGDPR